VTLLERRSNSNLTGLIGLKTYWESVQVKINALPELAYCNGGSLGDCGAEPL